LLLQRRQTIPVIGYLSFGTATESVESVAAFIQGVAAAGYVEGRDVAAESGATRTPIPEQGGQHSGDCGQRVMMA
jgi:hypothetical protein